MSVRVEITFNNVDEAIVALGKMALPAKAVVAPAAQAAPAAETKTPRKPRSDAGQARGPYKDAKGADAGGSVSSAATDGAPAVQAVVGVGGGDPVTPKSSPAVQTTAASAPAAPIAAPAAVIATPPTPAPAAATPTADDVQKAVEVLFTAKGYDTTLALLKGKYGVSRGKDVGPEQRANFIREANEAAAL